MSLNLTSKKEGREKKYNINMVPSGWTNPYLRGMVYPCTVEGQLDVTGSIIANDTGSAVNKMQEVNDANTLVDTFTNMDQNGKMKCEAEGNHRGTGTSVVDVIEVGNGTSDK
jgi:hypothetical protein